MNATIAHSIVLITYGNAYLRTGKWDDLYLQNAVFEFCNSICFKEAVAQSTNQKIILFAEDSRTWLDLLKKEGCEKLRLFHSFEKEANPDLDQFLNGGSSFFVECVYGQYTDLWIPNWQFDEKQQEKPWLIDYVKVVSKKETKTEQFDFQIIKSDLDKTLDEIIAFSWEEDLDGWVRIFEASKKILKSTNLEDELTSQHWIIKDKYDAENLRLLLAADTAFVFGGMGSWNDLWFDDEEAGKKYSSLTRKLYAATRKAIIVAINQGR